MTKIITSLAVDGISGRSGDTVFYRRNGFTYNRKLQQYKAPVDPTQQSYVKSIFSALSAEYTYLSPEVQGIVKDSAIAYGPPKTKYYPLAYYKSINFINAMAGRALTDFNTKMPLPIDVNILATPAIEYVTDDSLLEMIFPTNDIATADARDGFMVKITKNVNPATHKIQWKTLRLVQGVTPFSFKAMVSGETQTLSFSSTDGSFIHGVMDTPEDLIGVEITIFRNENISQKLRYECTISFVAP